MKVEDEDLLDEFRIKTHCECCGKRCRVEPHHFHAKGMGGGSTLDIRENLLALCRLCHDQAHWGRIERPHLLGLIAAREGRTPEECQQTIWDTLSRKK